VWSKPNGKTLKLGIPTVDIQQLGHSDNGASVNEWSVGNILSLRWIWQLSWQKQGCGVWTDHTISTKGLEDYIGALGEIFGMWVHDKYGCLKLSEGDENMATKYWDCAPNIILRGKDVQSTRLTVKIDLLIQKLQMLMVKPWLYSAARLQKRILDGTTARVMQPSVALKCRFTNWHWRMRSSAKLHFSYQATLTKLMLCREATINFSAWVPFINLRSMQAKLDSAKHLPENPYFSRANNEANCLNGLANRSFASCCAL